MKAWWFCPVDRCLPNDDGRQVRVGRTLKVKGPVVLCKHGLHASRRLLDALAYARSSLLCRVEMGGEIVHGNDKLAATERTVLWMLDIAPVLHEFACREAEWALRLADSQTSMSGFVDPRPVAAIQAKRRWLRGEITHAELAAARAAATVVHIPPPSDPQGTVGWAAARAAAAAAAGAVGWSPIFRPDHVDRVSSGATGWIAARAATGAAAMAAAGAAAEVAARAASAAIDAAGAAAAGHARRGRRGADSARHEMGEYVDGHITPTNHALRIASLAARRAAARTAARARQNRRLTAMVVAARSRARRGGLRMPLRPPALISA